MGRPSVPPEKLFRALLPQVFYSIRSERQPMEQIGYNLLFRWFILLFRWFIRLSMDAAVWDVTVFTKNRDRLLEGDDEPPGPGRNGERDSRGEKRSNETHASTTDPEAKLYRKANGQSSRMAFMGHALMENRNGLVVGALVTQASGAAEREAALKLVDGLKAKGRITLGADKGYDARGFVRDLRSRKVAPHVARNEQVKENDALRRRSAIDGRTTRHPGYAVSLRIRKRIEEVFGWTKTIGGLRKTRHKGARRADWIFTLTAAAYNLVKLPKLMAAA